MFPALARLPTFALPETVKSVVILLALKVNVALVLTPYGSIFVNAICLPVLYYIYVI